MNDNFITVNAKYELTSKDVEGVILTSLNRYDKETIFLTFCVKNLDQESLDFINDEIDIILNGHIASKFLLQKHNTDEDNEYLFQLKIPNLPVIVDILKLQLETHSSIFLS